MAAGEEWDAVAADPEFQKQPEATKNRVAMAFFNQRIAPAVPPAQHEEARHAFFADAFKPPVQAPEPGLGATLLETAKQTAAAPVPGLAPVADAVRHTIPEAIAGAGERVGLPRVGAGIGAAVGTVGELIPKTGGELAAAGLGGPILEGAGALGAQHAPTVVSKLTGRSLPEAQRAISRASELLNPELLKPETVDNATQALGDSLKAARSALGRRLGLAEDAAAARVPGRVVSAGQIGDELAARLQKTGVAADGKALGDIPNKIHPEVQRVIDKFRNLDAGTPATAPTVSRIVDASGAPIVSAPGAAAVPAAPRSLSIPDAIQLKRDIYDMVSYDKSKLLGLGDAESTFLKEAAAKLDARIRDVGGADLNAATDRFSRMAKGYDKLGKNALSGKVETVQKRLGRIFNAGDVARKVMDPLAEVGAGQRALDTVLDAKTAQGFQPVFSPYVERAAKHTGGGVLGAAGVAGGIAAGALKGGLPVAAGMAGTVAATSPRLHMAAIRAAMVPLGENAAVDALASPAARAVVASPLMRRLQRKEK